MIKLKTPEGSAPFISKVGEVYRDIQGVITVAEDEVEHLLARGCSFVEGILEDVLEEVRETREELEATDVTEDIELPESVENEILDPETPAEDETDAVNPFTGDDEEVESHD